MLPGCFPLRFFRCGGRLPARMQELASQDDGDLPVPFFFCIFHKEASNPPALKIRNAGIS